VFTLQTHSHVMPCTRPVVGSAIWLKAAGDMSREVSISQPAQRSTTLMVTLLPPTARANRGGQSVNWWERGTREKNAPVALMCRPQIGLLFGFVPS
jgi:hypothetical protein